MYYFIQYSFTFAFMKKKSTVIRIRGLVQGVGFRPFIYKIATCLGIKGEVRNDTDGVLIRAYMTASECEDFIFHIKNEYLPVATIHSIIAEETEEIFDYKTFTISKSLNGNCEVTQVAPDIAVCPDCIADRTRQKHRIHYPFINCTRCGPRFSIIRDLPYDREKTTMDIFTMCPDCRKEYENITDRRFHAQPVACNQCGPTYYGNYDGVTYNDYPSLLNITAWLIRNGEVIAAKGIGGYHLICDASNEEAVSRLREIKERDTKPFAVMFRDAGSVQEYACANLVETDYLLSWRRPIVLLKQVKPLASGINPGMHTLGCMLPYMPVHYDWFDLLDIPALVMTSGNLCDLPIAVTPSEADDQLKDTVSFILHHNREIHNRVDDSVVQVCNDLPCIIRRSRGYAPEPFFAGQDVEGILGFGAEKTSTFALGKGDTVIQSQYIGDLKNWETFNFYTGAMERFQRLFRFEPRMLVCDMHPDYLSSREAERISASCKLPLVKVQHHHAHAVACMAEYGICEPVVAIVMDGTGLGHDGNIWGGEFLLCDRTSFRRLSHLEYIPLPGGDRSSLEPWRMAVAYLHTYGIPFPADFQERIGEEKIRRLQQIIDKKIHTPLTSGAGRLFDAVSSLLGICDIASRQGEAPVLLEQQAAGHAFCMDKMPYPFQTGGESISLYPVFEGITKDISKGIDRKIIASRFHTTFARLLTEKAKELVKQSGVSKVVVSGGCFQNKLLTRHIQYMFEHENMPLYIPSKIPCNDSGLAAGQIIIAANKTN